MLVTLDNNDIVEYDTYKMQYNKNFICIFNKQTGEIFIKNFTDKIKSINIDDKTLDLNLSVNSVNIIVNKTFSIDSLLDENKESIFLNSKMSNQIKNDLESIEWRKNKELENRQFVIEQMNKLQENNNAFNLLLKRIDKLENEIKILKEESK